MTDSHFDVQLVFRHFRGFDSRFDIFILALLFRPVFYRFDSRFDTRFDISTGTSTHQNEKMKIFSFAIFLVCQAHLCPSVSPLSVRPLEQLVSGLQEMSGNEPKRLAKKAVG